MHGPSSWNGWRHLSSTGNHSTLTRPVCRPGPVGVSKGRPPTVDDGSRHSSGVSETFNVGTGRRTLDSGRSGQTHVSWSQFHPGSSRPLFVPGDATRPTPTPSDLRRSGPARPTGVEAHCGHPQPTPESVEGRRGRPTVQLWPTLIGDHSRHRGTRAGNPRTYAAGVVDRRGE